jgi:ethanolamine ammonia-lyase small subunit
MKRLRDFTTARVALGRTGNSVPVREMLDFQLAHARARDAVYAAFDAARMVSRTAGVVVRSQARDRAEYLKRPDKGRRLDAGSQALLSQMGGEYDAAFVVCDGLSPRAVEQSAAALIDRIRPRLEGWRLAPVIVCEQGRVAIGDEIGQALGAALSIVLIGERPGLSAADSMGVYLTWGPRPGRTDAERNCISNIRPEGLAVEAAAELLWFLMNESRSRRLSGVALKAPFLPESLPQSSTGAKLASSASLTT